MADRVKPNYAWDWVNGMHIGYTPERIRVEGRGGAVEYVPDAGTCQNVHDGREFECSKCGCNVEVVGEDGGKLSKVCSTAYKPRYCPYCGAKVVE